MNKHFLKFKSIDWFNKNTGFIRELSNKDVEYVFSVPYVTEHLPSSTECGDYAPDPERYGDVVRYSSTVITASTLKFFEGRSVEIVYGSHINILGGSPQYHAECITPDHRGLRTLIINDWMEDEKQC